MLVSKFILLLIIETIVFLMVGVVFLFLMFLAQKKKHAALLGAAVNQVARSEPIVDESSESAETSSAEGYILQLDGSLKKLAEDNPGLMPCSDPQVFADASEQEQATMIRYLVLDYEKKIIEGDESEDDLAAPFVASIDVLFKNEGAESEDPTTDSTDNAEDEPNAEIDQLSNQNRMNQEVIDQFARESREMLNCISTLESENKDLRKLLDVKSG